MKYIKKILQLLLLFSVFSVKADPKIPPLRPLSDSAYITVLTCAPGSMLYSTFGHSAFGVVDPVQGVDWVFNYGTFNFNTPHFYLKFASGKLLYKLGVERRSRFLREYKTEHRMVVEDRLNLTQTQKQQLFDALVNNYKPENRYYQYDFFFDNCATRVLDLLYKALGDSLQFMPPENLEEKTFRNLIDEYLIYSHWSDFGIDIALGSVIDRTASEREKAFLPDYLKVYLDYTTINGKPLFYGEKMVVDESEPLPETNFWWSPELWVWALFVVLVLFTFFYRKKSWIIGDRIIFSTFGLVGIVVFLLWFATDHDATAGNLNILWANPLYLVFAALIGRRSKKLVKWSALVFLAINVLVLCTWNILPQQFHVLIVPIIGILIIRLFIIVIRNWRKF